jgi:prepilin-type N-terminal cleavage/methylation domain-containing protein
MPRRSAFTLIELLVTISIIAILIAILLPALGKARQSSRELASLSNVRTIHQTFQMYHDQYKSYPFIRGGVKPEGFDAPSPPGIYFIRWHPSGTIIGTDQVWAMSVLWPGLVSTMAPWEEHYKTWISPGRPAKLPDGTISMNDDGISDVSYRYSNSFLAQPKLWKEGGPGGIIDDSMIKAISVAEVGFPSDKVMLWDHDLAYYPKEPEKIGKFYNSPTPMAFVDGHGAAKNPTKAKPGTPNPLNNKSDLQLHNTTDGVQGRDFD